jgi:DNA-binding response OmpR family regulator
VRRIAASSFLGDSSSTPTVLMVGEPACERAAEFLRLGAVVVLAPNEQVLRAWQLEDGARLERTGGGSSPSSHAEASVDQLEVDLRAHLVLWRGRALRLTELEYRVLAVLASEPGAAWTFRDLRRAGWGDSQECCDDVMPVRSVVQRIRTKLRSESIPARVQSVRGYGFRLEADPTSSASLAIHPSGATA